MNKVFAAAIALWAVSLFSPGEARADWAYTHWGMTPEQVVAASNGTAKLLPQDQRTRDDADHWEMSVQGGHVDEALRLGVGFMFDTRQGGLMCVVYNVTGDKDVHALAARLQQRYGKPLQDNSFGPLRMLTWRTPDEIEYASNGNPVAAAVTQCRPKAR